MEGVQGIGRAPGDPPFLGHFGRLGCFESLRGPCRLGAGVWGFFLYLGWFPVTALDPLCLGQEGCDHVDHPAQGLAGGQGEGGRQQQGGGQRERMAQAGGEQEQEQHLCLDVETQLGDAGRVQRLVSSNVSVKLCVLQTACWWSST